VFVWEQDPDVLCNCYALFRCAKPTQLVAALQLLAAKRAAAGGKSSGSAPTPAAQRQSAPAAAAAPADAGSSAAAPVAQQPVAPKRQLPSAELSAPMTGSRQVADAGNLHPGGEAKSAEQQVYILRCLIRIVWSRVS
jgi:hypothetical protein